MPDTKPKLKKNNYQTQKPNPNLYLLNVSIFADNIFNSEKMTDTKPKLKKKQLPNPKTKPKPKNQT